MARHGPLSDEHPEVAAQWHPTANGSLAPDDVTTGSSRTVWWVCYKGRDHEWPATIKSRAQGGSGCPMCHGLSVSVTNSLVALNPAIAAQWHPTRNEDLAPDQVVAGSAKKVWWQVTTEKEMTGLMTVLVAGADADGRTCTVADFTPAMREAGVTSVEEYIERTDDDAIDLPSGGAARSDEVSRDGSSSTAYVLEESGEWFILFCGAPDPPDDHWLSIAETFEFLPAEE